jgi:hypothetical protein
MKLCLYCGRENDDVRSTCQECGTLLLTQLKRDRRQWIRLFVVSVALIAAGCFCLIVIAVPWWKPKRFDGIKITGTPEFKDQVIGALVLLKTRSPEAYQIVTNYIGAIAQASRSGMAAQRNPPTYDLNERSAFHSLTWCAGSIAHDSIHSKLYHDYLRQHPGSNTVPDDIWTGEAVELRCLAHQIQVSKEIDAPSSEIGWLVKTNHHWWEDNYRRVNW